MSELPEISEIQRWKPEPGDRLIVRCATRLSKADGAYVEQLVRDRLQLLDDFPLLIIDDSVELQIASTE